MKTVRLAAFAFASLIASAALAGEFPSKAVHIVAPTPPGGGADVLAHILQPTLQKAWGQEFVPENKGGSRGRIGANFVAAAVPDGYTLLMG
ncbi:MAG TPA: tripartite tricarboxylate transporter substrate-binding protein, partial [Usitatibacter sp.]